MLLGRPLGVMDHAPAWFNDARTNVVAPGGRQTAATCSLHAVNHLMHGLRPGTVVMTRDIFESRCTQGFDAWGNYEYADMHANLSAHGCGVEMLSADVVETVTTRGIHGEWNGFFATGTLEASCILGYLVHVPGHWICVLPALLGAPETVAMLCDSLYTNVFLLTGPELAEWLEGMALQQTERTDSPHGVWSAYRVFQPTI